ncbi:hypothetical protein DB346_12870 [Verrucomicrobia bacterium LW23]|nr:hypothetical protein DB346_12870 [Verrucomicrobia bacterium LW23]
MNRGPLSLMMRGGDAGVAFQSGLQDDLDLSLCHGLTQIPVDDGAGVAVENGGEVMEGARDVNIRDIDMPMLVRRKGLHKAGLPMHT